MTQEEKFLLFQDLCARLPYGVEVKTNRGSEKIEGLAPFCYNEIKIALNLDWSMSISDYTPYLRPMSSMTEEELNEYRSYCRYHNIKGTVVYEDTYKSFDWLNKKMFDYRNLISEGLALKAPNGMYK